MRKIALILAMFCCAFAFVARADTRDVRAEADKSRIAANTRVAQSPTVPTGASATGAQAAASRGGATAPQTTSARTAVTPRSTGASPQQNTVSRVATTRTNTAAGANTVAPARAALTPGSGTLTRTGVSQSTAASTTAARAAVGGNDLVSDTRIGAAYENCKIAYFTCMDQFCAAKNVNFQRCSCSERVLELQEAQKVMEEASQELLKFTENLDTVGMSSAQATAMKTASEGENALIGDGSAAKALLQAIMNSIKGQDATVGGKYTPLNVINLKMDTNFAFGFGDIGQAIAAYNGKNLYSVIYGQCRQAIRADCTDAALQRAVTAYLMAIEQDCNTLQRINTEAKKQLTAAVREGGAMLNLARIENRQKHNINDMTACLHEVEAAVQSEEVCGDNYYKCLDNGKFIDISTGSPIAGVVNFYELENILTFVTDVALDDQRLTKIAANRPFISNFEKRVKQFAAPALDRCTEIADVVWTDFLDKAMIDIYYAQRAKVQEIRQGCLDFVSVCYMNGEKSLTAAMASLINTATTVQPDMITLNDALCTDYVQSCDNMFRNPQGRDIIAQYIESRTDFDRVTACRAAVQVCFDKFGGKDYVNFYSKHSGLFLTGEAWDWFTRGKSECWMQLCSIESCREVNNKGQYNSKDDCQDDKDNFAREVFGGFSSSQILGLGHDPAGVATEVYNRVSDTLMNQCKNLYGLFIERQHESPTCMKNGENVCPYRYENEVDIESWGFCSCYANPVPFVGNWHSENGTCIRCISKQYNEQCDFQ